jgi:hypothetical protein
MQKQQWHQAIRNLFVLIRYHPRGFASAMRSNPYWIEG